MSALDNPQLTPPEVVTGVVQHEYFKFQVQKQVEEQVHAYVSARFKVVAALATVALTALGAFGVRQYLTFTSIVEAVEKQSSELNKEIAATREEQRKAKADLDETIKDANENLRNSKDLANVAHNTAQQTNQVANLMLEQVQNTQKEVISRSSDFQERISASAKSIQQLNEAQAEAQAAAATLNGIQDAAKEAERNFKAIQEAAAKVETTKNEVETTKQNLNQRLDLERQLMVAKTFEIVLLRDRRSVEITLPDVIHLNAKPYTFKIEATRIKDDVDFRITINDRKAVQSFDRFAQGQRAEIAEDVPFEVRVDSIYHAKLAFDFVLLRIKPKEGLLTSPGPTIAASTARR